MSSSKIRRVIGTIDLTIDLTAEETIDLTLMEEQQEDRMLSVGVEREDEEGLFQCSACLRLIFHSESVSCPRGCLEVCPRCITGAARSVAEEGHEDVYCCCGEELPLESLKSLLTADLYKKLYKKKELAMAKESGLEYTLCPGCQAVILLFDSDNLVLKCHNEDCLRRSCKLCKNLDHTPQPCQSIVTILKPSRDVNEEDPLEVKYRLYESHFSRQMAVHGKGKVIKSMDIVENVWMERAFQKKQEEFRRKGINDKLIFAYHGTTAAVIPAIIANNFDISKAVRQAHGRGNYFSEFPETAFGYSDDKKKIILAKILPGKEYKGNKLQWPGYNSKLVQVGAGGYSQMVIIEDKDQILPLAVLYF